MSKKCVFLGYSNQHKGYKCLEPATGRVYISRDVIFDKNLFPFASLHPNTSAQLRAEIALLPNSLQNPPSSLGDLYVPDQCVDSSLTADDSQNSARDLMNAGENLVSFGSNQENTRGNLMCSPSGGSTGFEVASPTVVGHSPGGESTSSSRSVPLGIAPPTGGDQAGSSADVPDDAVSDLHRVAVHQDPNAAPPDLQGSAAVPPPSVVEPSSAAPAVPPVPPSQQGPVTWL
jgi:hypothetical protein